MKSTEINYDFYLSIAYNDTCVQILEDLINLLKTYPNVNLTSYNESTLKGRRKAFMLKGGYSAKLSPFVVIYDIDKNPLKAFYSEVEECTVENIKFYLDMFIIQQKQNTYESTNS